MMWAAEVKQVHSSVVAPHLSSPLLSTLLLLAALALEMALAGRRQALAVLLSCARRPQMWWQVQGLLQSLQVRAIHRHVKVTGTAGPARQRGLSFLGCFQSLLTLDRTWPGPGMHHLDLLCCCPKCAAYAM